MKKEDIIARMRAFPYDKNEYWVITGGAMVLYGFREETHDIDIGCTSAMAARLEADGYLCGVSDEGKREFRIGDEIEIFEDWLFDRVDSVDGIPVISVDGLVTMKRLLGREKDKRDLVLIERSRGGHAAEEKQ